MDAKTALHISDSYFRAEMKPIFDKIAEAAAKGQLFIREEKKISWDQRKTLERMGYVVHTSYDRDTSTTTTSIGWGKSTGGY